MQTFLEQIRIAVISLLIEYLIFIPFFGGDKMPRKHWKNFLLITSFVGPAVVIMLVLMEVSARVLASFFPDVGYWARYLAWIVGIGSTLYPIIWSFAIYPWMMKKLQLTSQKEKETK
jgi:hypothetical protein